MGHKAEQEDWSDSCSCDSAQRDPLEDDNSEEPQEGSGGFLFVSTRRGSTRADRWEGDVWTVGRLGDGRLNSPRWVYIRKKPSRRQRG